MALDSQISARLKRNVDGLVCAVVQQYDSREVLMVGWVMKRFGEPWQRGA